MEQISSKFIQDAVDELAKLPGIGKKTALRLALFLLKQSVSEVESFGNAVIAMRKNISFCKKCHNICDTEICHICANPKRDPSKVCVVADIRDVMAIENTHQYTGLYHVLGGIISPMDGIGPQDLTIESLVSRIGTNEITEVIMALSTTMEGEMTNHYLFKRLKTYNIQISTIARGIAIGDELEYADELTLGQSILNRHPYENRLQTN